MLSNLKSLVKEGVDNLEDHFSNNSCNDLEVINTPEIRQLWDEYFMYEFGTERGDDDFFDPFEGELENAKVIAWDGLIVYALKKQLGLMGKD